MKRMHIFMILEYCCTDLTSTFSHTQLLCPTRTVQITVEPASILDCGASNASHSVIRCVTRAGRGAGNTVRVTVAGQMSTQGGGGGTTSAVIRDGESGNGVGESGGGGNWANISYFPPRITSVLPNRGAGNSPEKITIFGDSFGVTPTNVRVFLGGSSKDKECTGASWMPRNPPKYENSYIRCDPPRPDTSGEKNITLEFADDEDFLTATKPLVFLGFYAVSCSKGEYHRPSDGLCATCPTGATCLGGDDLPVALPGYMQINFANISVGGAAVGVPDMQFLVRARCNVVGAV